MADAEDTLNVTHKSKRHVRNKSCKLCHEEDNEGMVQCDVCNEWFHFLCTGTSSDIENQEWSCTQCMDKKNAEDNDKSSSVDSIALSRRKLIQLNLLEEERKMHEKRDAEFLRKKAELLMEDSDDEGCTSDDEGCTSSKSNGQLLQRSPNSMNAEQQMLTIANISAQAKNAAQRNNDIAVNVARATTSAKIIHDLPLTNTKVVYNQINTNIRADNFPGKEPHPVESVPLSSHQIAAWQSRRVAVVCQQLRRKHQGVWLQ